jgi:type IV secretory pathway component VirB8
MDDEFLPPDDEAKLRDPVFNDVLSAHEARVAANRATQAWAWRIAGGGMLMGLIGVAAVALAVIISKPDVRYDVIDPQSGIIHPSFGAKDAPNQFSERVIDHYLAEYISNRETWVRQLDPLVFHTVAIMSATDEQKRYAAERLKDNPQEKYGQDGYSRIVRFLDPSAGGFHRITKGKDGTFEYDVQFLKGEVLAADPGKPVETWETARIVFQLHPQLAMSEPDRLQNEAGLYVLSYSVRSDK